MTQLLISVKNSEEAMLALAAGVDIIDLKDPHVGALGALNLVITKEIVALVNGKTFISATVGEHHLSVRALVADIQVRVDTGVNIVKIAASDLFQAADFYDEIYALTKSGVKLVVVFFADAELDLTLLHLLKKVGFYGAMLDTQHKQKDLLSLQTNNELRHFIQKCHQYQLICGLAGSLKPQYVDVLLEINPTYIGFRGGVCENSQRTSSLKASKVSELMLMLRNDNKNCTKAQLILSLALHS